MEKIYYQIFFEDKQEYFSIYKGEYTPTAYTQYAAQFSSLEQAKYIMKLLRINNYTIQEIKNNKIIYEYK